MKDSGRAVLEEAKHAVEECSRRVLEVSLGTSGLSNLQRARLLDILLWASDISSGAHSRRRDPWGLTGNPEPRAQTEEKRQAKLRGWPSSITY